MSETLHIDPIVKVSGAVGLPGSKSISNRVLLLSALSSGTTELTNLLVAEDTDMMIGALRALGVKIEQDGDHVIVHGCAGKFPVRNADLFLGNAGTALRPLASTLAFSGGQYVLDGVARMRQRPIGHLVDALNSIGARVSCLKDEGFPPILIEPSTRITSDIVVVNGSVSSQFVSGLLIAAPQIAPSRGLIVRIEGELVSSPYVTLTCRLMAKFGVVVSNSVEDYVVPSHPYISPGKLNVESDASGASYFLALGALCGPLKVEGLGRDSIQGDASFVEYLAKMGAVVTRGENWIKTAPPAFGHKLEGISADYRQIPDAAMTIAAIAPLCSGPSTLRGIGSWRVKETDRIAAMAAELTKVGCRVETGEDWMTIYPPEELKGAEFDTYDDHRMAMCMSLIAAGGVGVDIRNPGCVVKTFPDYFERLNSIVNKE